MMTQRGQTLVPSRLRRKAQLRAGNRLHWYAVSDREFRVVVETADDAPGPLAALGWTRRLGKGTPPGSDAAMREIRVGETP